MATAQDLQQLGYTKTTDNRHFISDQAGVKREILNPGDFSTYGVNPNAQSVDVNQYLTGTTGANIDFKDLGSFVNQQIGDINANKNANNLVSQSVQNLSQAGYGPTGQPMTQQAQATEQANKDMAKANNPGYFQTPAVTGPPDFSNIKAAHEAATASGVTPPDSQGAAQSAMTGFVSAAAAVPSFYKPDPNSQQVFNAQGQPVSYDQFIQQGGKSDFSNVRSGNPGPSQPTPLSGIEQQLAADPGYQQLLKDRAEYNSVANQGKSLLDTYNQMTKEAGIPGLNAELINTQKIIEGTEDDIRNEVRAVSGFATDSQVLALASARNKTLVKNYNALLATKQAAMEQVNNMVNLAGQDRQFAMQAIQQKMQIDEQLNTYRDKFINNAKEGYNNVIQAIGYGGLYESLKGDPAAMALAERTLGLASGQIQKLGTYVKPLTASEQVDLDTRKFQLSQAKAEAPLDLKLKQAQLANINSEIANRGRTSTAVNTQVVDMGNGKKVLIDSRTGAVINEIGSNPVDNTVKSLVAGSANWGDAADKINKAFGDPSAASRYDSQLKSYFGNKQNIDTAFSTTAPEQQKVLTQQKSQIDQIGNILNGKGLSEAVGPNFLSRSTGLLQFLAPGRLSGSIANFVGDVEQIRSQLNLQSLLDAKAKGATFGALSEQELRTLSNSATKIGQWAIEKNGKVVGYNASQKDFKKELDKINNFAKLDFIMRGGNPDEVGVQVLPDGTHWTKNSDGSMTQF
jgi:hypothetical protein